ncbi:MAG: M61 family metallopeptidase [Candidatus Polarisedimenticolia bacterium]
MRAMLAVLTLTAAAPATAATTTLSVHVDATEATRRLLHARLTVPASPGPLSLVYPRWIPGEHGPTGPITDVAGLRIEAGGRPLAWRRNPTDMNAFEVTVPEGAGTVHVAFDLLMAPPAEEGFSSGASASARLAVLNWNQLVVYPSGLAMRDVLLEPSLTVPAGWGAGTALQTVSRDGDRMAFARVTLETLVDSPVIIGAHHRRIAIGPPGGRPHFIEAAADSPEALVPPASLQAAWDQLVVEILSMFGATHYDSYRFLVALSDHVAHFGLEHHESSDNRVPERTWLEEDLRRSHATLLPHEFVHSWNAKYRRPADMMVPDFQKPVRTELLWVYEGLTQYLGQVLAARSGLWTQEDYRDKLALIAQWATDQTGRSWRPLADTGVTAQLLFEARRDWRTARRGTDFYDEGTLIWLDVDTLIREQSNGRKSLEDFLRRFHGAGSGPPEVKPYRREDLVRVLGEVQPYDWDAFFRRRAEEVAPEPPLQGIERAGWRLSWADTPSKLQKAYDGEDKLVNLSASIGLVVKEDGTVLDVVPGKPADRAGIGPRMKLAAVNGRRYTHDVMRAGVAATRQGTALELLVDNAGFLSSHTLAYSGGERYPRLERIEGKPDLLKEISSPKTK